MNDQRRALIAEYVIHRMQMGDWDEEEEEMTTNERLRHFKAYALQLTDDQLVRACNSYAMAD